MTEPWSLSGLHVFNLADDMSTSSAREGYLAAGVNSILPKEHAGTFVNLPITKAEMDNGFVCSTYSSKFS